MRPATAAWEAWEERGELITYPPVNYCDYLLGYTSTSHATTQSFVTECPSCCTKEEKASRHIEAAAFFIA